MARRLGLAIAALILMAAAPSWDWRSPAGLRPSRVPSGNPMSAAKVELGRRLFYDADLSVDGTMACATCHEQHRAFADGNAAHAGVHGDPGRRNVPGLANVAWLRPLTWGDPRIGSLEAQAAIPVTGTAPVEMGMAGQDAEIARRLSTDSCYPAMFAKAFPGDGTIDFEHVAKALAAFERTLVSFDTAYDANGRGGRTAMPSEAVAGSAVFDRHCRSCHSGPLLTDQKFHRIRSTPGPDAGLGEITRRTEDVGRFRTPSLRNVELTGPYFHDGSAKTIADAVRLHPRTSDLRDAQVMQIVAFLNSLTDRHFTMDARFSLPEFTCGK
ncbi:cytochrome-c peroxidase [Glacieibacterium megasporae]|uniref:cytochrome-c peroxidase n=1 Tax=Glacieibacterium megasporae TaxID=2835787 RepID=UPI001C1E8AD1|nr:cytochrome-c peroxidase [Polymorphobacter megasporae]UAJ09919.1 cytochrome-c peroxidase [Polymorphobacter megasporae]